jgi:peptide/nickel transport system ATP-binding protein
MPERDVLLEVNDLERHFDVSAPALERLLQSKQRVAVKALDGVTFTISRGETFSLVGESGCGKTTVARCVVGLYRPTAGNISLTGSTSAG